LSHININIIVKFCFFTAEVYKLKIYPFIIKTIEVLVLESLSKFFTLLYFELFISFFKNYGIKWIYMYAWMLCACIYLCICRYVNVFL